MTRGDGTREHGQRTRQPPAGVRRVPSQARSQARVGRLLDAAERIILRDGIDALSTHRIAAEAGVPIGTVYQFFADKQGVVDALARSYIEGSEQVMSRLLSAASGTHWSDLVSTVIDAFVARYRSKPAYRVLWTGPHLGAELQRENAASNDAMAAMLRELIVENEGLRDAARGDPGLLRSCRLAIHVGEAVLRLAFAEDPDGDEAVIDEVKDLERAYLEQVVRRHASPGGPGPGSPSRTGTMASSPHQPEPVGATDRSDDDH